MHAIVADAASRGIQTLEASVLANNDATHRLVRRLWPGTTSIVDHDVVEYRLPLAQVTTVRAPVLVHAATSADRTALRTGPDRRDWHNDRTGQPIKRSLLAYDH